MMIPDNKRDILTVAILILSIHWPVLSKEWPRRHFDLAGFRYATLAESIIESFVSPDLTDRRHKEYARSRIAFRNISAADLGPVRCKLSSALNDSDFPPAWDLIVVAGASRDILQRQTLEKMLADKRFATAHWEIRWALAEIGTQPNKNLRAISSIVMSRNTDPSITFRCWKLLLFSSRNESISEIMRVAEARPIDGAYSEELGCYANYRKLLLKSAK